MAKSPAARTPPAAAPNVAFPESLRKPHFAAWEKDYARRGAVWRGTTNFNEDLPDGSRVLELGVGNGKNLSALIHSGKHYDIDAIDISPSAIRHSEHFLAGLEKSRPDVKKHVRLRVMDVCDLDFFDNHFDVVICFHMVDALHADERAQAAAEIARVLKPGGRVFLKVWRTDDMRRHKGVEVEPGSVVRQNGILYHYFGMNELQRLFEDAGLNLDFLWCDSWNVHYAGKTFVRREIHAEFCKGKPSRTVAKSSKMRVEKVKP